MRSAVSRANELTRMRIGQSQLMYLKEMVRHGNGESSRHLVARISDVQQQERRSRVCLFGISGGLLVLLGVLALFARTGAQPPDPVPHLMTQALLWLAGAALFGVAVILACWLRHRSTLRKLVHEARRYLAGWMMVHPGYPPGHLRKRHSRIQSTRIPSARQERLRACGYESGRNPRYRSRHRSRQ
jgi:hypothetical protein